MINSPCISKCALNETRSFCISCGRSLEEIKGWKTFDDSSKKQSLAWSTVRLYEYTNSL